MAKASCSILRSAEVPWSRLDAETMIIDLIQFISV
jgi:hypothetical protein